MACPLFAARWSSPASFRWLLLSAGRPVWFLPRRPPSTRGWLRWRRSGSGRKNLRSRRRSSVRTTFPAAPAFGTFLLDEPLPFSPSLFPSSTHAHTHSQYPMTHAARPPIPFCYKSPFPAVPHSVVGEQMHACDSTSHRDSPPPSSCRFCPDHQTRDSALIIFSRVAHRQAVGHQESGAQYQTNVGHKTIPTTSRQPWCDR